MAATEDVGNGDLELGNLSSFNLMASKSPSRRQAYFGELLSKDFSKPVYSKDKLYEYCKALQTLGLELRVEVQRLQSEINATSALDHSTSSRRTTDDSDICKKTAPAVPADQIAVVFNPSDNDLRRVKGRDMESRYITVDLPPYNWWQDSLHLYFSTPRDRKLTKIEITVSNKKKVSTKERDLQFIRTINLGNLGFGIKLRRMFGRLKTIYVLAPETRHAEHQTGPAMRPRIRS